MKKNLTKHEQWKEGHVVKENRVFDSIYTISPDRAREC